jgi:hypothetical protein
MADDGVIVDPISSSCEPLTEIDVDAIVDVVINNRLSGRRWMEVHNRVFQMCNANLEPVTVLWRYIETVKAATLGEDGMMRMRRMFMYYHRWVERVAAIRTRKPPTSVHFNWHVNWHVIRDHSGEDYYVFYDAPQTRPENWAAKEVGRFYGTTKSDAARTLTDVDSAYVKLYAIERGSECWSKTIPWTRAIVDAKLTDEDVRLVESDVLAYHGAMEKYRNTLR